MTAEVSTENMPIDGLPPAGDNDTATPGALLRKTRQLRELSCEQVADALHITAQKIRALEQDRYEEVGAPAFVSGYLRNYARLLELDAASLMDRYRVQCQRQPPLRVRSNPVGARLPLRASKDRPMLRWSVALVVLALGGLWWAGVAWRQPATDTTVVSVDAPVVIDIADRSLVAELTAKPADAGAAPIWEMPLVAETQPAAEATAVAPATDNLAAPQQAASADVVIESGESLNMYFSGDCWVEIRDGDGKVLVASLKRAEDRLSLRGSGPFHVLLGYAPAASVSYNGRPVDIKVNEYTHSARLVVGRS